jgi:branched-chain amino acid aminotransferase
MTPEQVKQAMVGCVKATGLADAYVEIICTRGQPQPGSRDPRTCQNQFWAFAIPFVNILEPGKEGLSVVISERQRIAAASVDPTIKNYHWLDLVLGLYEAYDRGAESVLLVDENGYLCEGPGFNVFIVQGRQLVTPQSGVLQGITRKTILELGNSLGLDVCEADITSELALQADEVFVTSTAGGLMPVITLNGTPVGDGEPGPLTRQLKQAYWKLHDDPRYALPVFGGVRSV